MRGDRPVWKLRSRVPGVTDAVMQILKPRLPRRYGNPEIVVVPEGDGSG